MKNIEDIKLSVKDFKAIEEFSKRIKDKLESSLIEIRLFGSKARGKSMPDSDIDILIITKETNEKIKDIIFDITVDVNLIYDVVICPIIIAHKTYTDPLANQTNFYRAVREEGLTL
ncbi:hypothetical protein H0A61_00761 [Koleobacter methoxysyntrophicus]|jgi:predicted nucleotidyltransferase|uniref:Polymerase nucleotidyl transferase domain-containing protein n=1 Tax=Koleobacter methoxysyntrophicus TaxID=2751313 RepID=A0A8A0RLP4_9FIRM|nr:nucleotidyltransferase domain-containing protein [Koleobacter methoxysyntrophicus]QSQ08439.1 hypothetical protein H0A61_00761 [Koleobacter methoxysyntrophicus]